MFGAELGCTCAVHAVVASPSIASAGSPKPASGYSYGLYVLAAFVSSRIALGGSALVSLGFDSVVDDFSEDPVFDPAVDSPVPVEVPVPDDFGVDVVEGIFGGFPVVGNSGLFAPVPPCDAFGAGTFGVLAAPGVVGMLVVGVVATGACATVSVRGGADLFELNAAAPAAAAAPVSNTAASAKLVSGRQFVRSPRLPG